jgi:hypothetical protein
MAEANKREMPVAFLAGAVIVAILVVGAVLWSTHASRTPAAAPAALPFGSAEQAYASQINFTKPQNTPMSRATNFLNQEVTYIFGTAENDGPRTVNQIQVTLEYHDIFNQVVLRDTKTILPEQSSLAPGQHYDFQLSYEHLPEQWNQQYPTMKISGLDLK